MLLWSIFVLFSRIYASAQSSICFVEQLCKQYFLSAMNGQRDAESKKRNLNILLIGKHPSADYYCQSFSLQKCLVSSANTAQISNVWQMHLISIIPCHLQVPAVANGMSPVLFHTEGASSQLQCGSINNRVVSHTQRRPLFISTKQLFMSRACVPR